MGKMGGEVLVKTEFGMGKDVQVCFQISPVPIQIPLPVSLKTLEGGDLKMREESENDF